MNCPVCADVNLNLAERQGVEIDYCPKCRGVWLDRGELDKVIERVGAGTFEAAVSREERHAAEPHDHRHGHEHEDFRRGRHHRKSMFERLFDFD